MKKTIIFCLLFLFSTPILFAQSPCDTVLISKYLSESSRFYDEYQLEKALKSALLAHQSALQCASQSPWLKKAFLLADKCYQNLALDFTNRGFFEKSIDVSERHIALHREMGTVYPDELSKAYRNLGAAHNLSDHQKLALEAFEKSLKIRQDANPLDPLISGALENLAQLSIDMKDSTKALAYLNEWESFHRKIGKKAGLQARMNLANSWSFYHVMMGNLPAAIKVVEDTLNMYGEKIRARGGFLGTAEFQLCEMLTLAGEYERAFRYSEKNIEYFEARMQKQRGRLFSRTHYAWCYAQSARSAWNLYLQSKDTNWYQIAVRRCTKAEDEIFAMRDRDPNDGFRDWIANELGLTANITEVRNGLYRLTGEKTHMARAFEVQEAFKTFSVQQFLLETEALNWGGLPDTIYQKETAYRQSIIDLETNFFMVRNQPNADSLIAANDRELFSLRDEYSRFLNNLEQDYPEYFRLKYHSYKVTLEEVQSRLLTDNQCVLDLFIENNMVFAMLIRRDTVVWSTGRETDALWQAIDKLQLEARQFNRIQQLPESEYLNHLRSYTEAAYRVYQGLIEPVRPLLKEEVLLVPRDQLAEIPFGALLTKRETNLAKPQMWHYLDQEFIISQTYSIGLFDFIQRRRQDRKQEKNVLALAPFFQGTISNDLTMEFGSSESRDQLFKTLPHSGEEVKAIARITNGKPVLGAAATKSIFNELSPDYGIIHLATHSLSNHIHGEYSMIALQSTEKANKIDLLYARDVYNIRLTADLVVLSACETGQGQFRKDEGIVGLTRAFTCAGARNVIASLWSVNDATTKDLMIYFYEELNKGLPYNRALANAKRQFIQHQKQFAHPYFWAGFELHGR
ncbi:MAG: CHAT domain-containing protein [Saprospiraceae bacterium]|nr:CHAT domain-containing protein [Saprospiraceae bacterium]